MDELLRKTVPSYPWNEKSFLKAEEPIKGQRHQDTEEKETHCIKDPYGYCQDIHSINSDHIGSSNTNDL